MAKRKGTIGIVGGGAEVSAETYDLAFEVGKHVANNGAILVCGGLGGVMEAAAKGASESGGVVVGFLPGEVSTEANPYVTVAVPTGMGIGRNVLVVRTSDVLIAFPGSYGTLSEIGLALNLGKTVINFPGGWDIRRIGRVDASLFKEAIDPRQAVGVALDALSRLR